VADSIKEGVVMYSEGMAVVKDMPGIVAGRVHNAIYHSPPLNLNKLIKPDFAIFRVMEIKDTHLNREVAISFFNGYGVELNSMGPGRSAGVKEDLRFLGETSLILRQNTGVFLSEDWTPLLSALKDSIWVNAWPGNNKRLFTVLSFRPEGHDGPLFSIQPEKGWHYVSLWRDEETEAVEMDGKLYLPASLEPYPASYRGTRREGRVDCIAAFPELISIDDSRHRLKVHAALGDELIAWRAGVSYSNSRKHFTIDREWLELPGEWIAGEEKLVLQVFEEGELIDQKTYHSDPGKAWLVSESPPISASGDTSGMHMVEGGTYTYLPEHDDSFIPYPETPGPVDTVMHNYFIDKQPVSNADFNLFLEDSGYRPADNDNFLRHWKDGKFPDSIADDPVVYVDHLDALAYAAWAGKRLPTEVEWQYAMSSNELGHGHVWEMTNDRYFNGSHSFIIIKGGSYFKPESSWWYIQGGKHPPERQQMLLQVSPGFDRASTVGFRCVMDMD
jgi:hypothetical protein